jgi:hypothetical protein
MCSQLCDGIFETGSHDEALSGMKNCEKAKKSMVRDEKKGEKGEGI